MDFAGLSSILWRERDVLENLLYKLDVQQLLLMAGRSTWLVRASAEIELVLEQVGQIELERAVVFDAVAADMGERALAFDDGRGAGVAGARGLRHGFNAP